MRKLLGILAAVTAGIGVMSTPIAAFAEYPDRPITIVVLSLIHISEPTRPY